MTEAGLTLGGVKVTAKQRRKRRARCIRQQVNDAKKRRLVECKRCGQSVDINYCILTARSGDFSEWLCFDCFRKGVSG